MSGRLLRIAIALAVASLATGALAALPTGALAASEPPSGAASCSGCHPASAGVETVVPRLAGRPAADIVAQMQAFRTGQQPATVMNRIANGYSETDVAAIAAWYAAQK
jgi:cytochrome c553